MKRFLLLLFPLALFAQINVQKNSSGVISNGNITVGNNTTISSSGSGQIISTSGVATTVPWSGVTSTPTSVSGYGITNGAALDALGAVATTGFIQRTGANAYSTVGTVGTGSVVLASAPSFTIGNVTITLGGTATNITGLTLTAPVIGSIVNTGTLTLPTATDTLVGRATTDTLTNKTFVNPTLGAASATSLTLSTPLAVTYGGTGLSTATLGDLRYGSGVNTNAILAGSTSSTMAVLTQTGTGTVSAAPVWVLTTGTGNIVRANSPSLTTPTLIGTVAGNLTLSSSAVFGIEDSAGVVGPTLKRDTDGVWVSNRELRMNGSGTGALFGVRNTSGTANAFATDVVGDTGNRFIIDVNGKHYWATGSAGADLSLERGSAGLLLLGGSLSANGKISSNASGTDVIKIADTSATGYGGLNFAGTGTQNYSVGMGGPSEAAFGVANKWYVYDGLAGAMRLTLDSAGLFTVKQSMTVAGNFTVSGSASISGRLTEASGVLATGTIGSSGSVFRSDAQFEAQNNSASNPAVISLYNQAVNPGDTTHEVAILFGLRDSAGNAQKSGAIASAFDSTATGNSQGRIIFHATYLMSGAESNDTVEMHAKGGWAFYGADSDIPGNLIVKNYSTIAATSSVTGSLQNAGGFGNAGAIYSGQEISSGSYVVASASNSVPSAGAHLTLEYNLGTDTARIRAYDFTNTLNKPLSFTASTYTFNGGPVTVSIDNGNLATFSRTTAGATSSLSVNGDNGGPYLATSAINNLTIYTGSMAAKFNSSQGFSVFGVTEATTGGAGAITSAGGIYAAKKIITASSLTTGDTVLHHTSVALTNGAAANTATFTNAPAAGNPTKWVPIDDNGTTRYVPAF